MKKTKWFTKQAASGTNLQEPIKDNAVSDYSTSFWTNIRMKLATSTAKREMI